MASLPRTQRWLYLSVLFLWSFSHVEVGRAQADDPVKEESKSEKVRKVLDQPIVLDFVGNGIPEVLNHLKEKTKVHFVLDIAAAGNIAAPFDDGMGGMNLNLMTIKSERGAKLRQTLRRFLTQFDLTYVILEDAVLITTEEMGLHRQMRQRVSVDFKEQPLKDVLKYLNRTTGINLILDPRTGAEADRKITLELEDGTLETTVKLVAELGNLKAVRLGNVLFVTSEERAAKIRREENQFPVINQVRPDGMVVPGGIGINFGGGMGGFAGPMGQPVPMAPPEAAPPLIAR